MQTMPLLPAPTGGWPYVYDPCIKHRRRTEGPAAFERRDSVLVGVCASDIGLADAVQLLRDGIGWGTDAEQPHPTYIFAVHAGIPYKAVWTGDVGDTVHGYPCHPRKDLAHLRDVRRHLEQAARDAGYGNAFRTWMNQP